MFGSWIRNFLTTLRGNSADLLVRIEIAVSLHVRESKTVLDSGFQAVDSGFQVLDSRSFSVELGFRIPTPVSRIRRSRIPDSSSKNFPWFRIPSAKICRTPESRYPYMGRALKDLGSGQRWSKKRNKHDGDFEVAHLNLMYGHVILSVNNLFSQVWIEFKMVSIIKQVRRCKQMRFFEYKHRPLV